MRKDPETRCMIQDEEAPENEEAVESELEHRLRELLREKEMKRVRSTRFLEERRREREQRSPEN